MITPVRIQRSRQHKQVSPNGLPIVYVGRPTKWGNPYRAIGCNVLGGSGEVIASFYKESDAKSAAIIMYKRWLLPYTHKSGTMDDYYISELRHEELKDLQGKNLSCWCKLGEKCHADVLLELANQ